MPFVLVIVGVALLVAAARGTHVQLGQQLAKDFTGSRGFLVWIAALLAIGAIGYVPALKRFSDGLLFLVLLSFLLSNTGLFARLKSAVENPPTSLADQNGSGSSSGGFGGSGNVGSLAEYGALIA